jgi:phosphatidylinositol alpha-mannosyltransferase
MRVGLVCPYDWDVPGGVKSHVRDLAEELIRQGHEVSVLAPMRDDEAATEPYVVSAGRSVPVRYNGSVARLKFGFGTTQTVRRWIQRGDFDVLHIHEPAAPSISIIACWVANGPLVGTWHSSHVRSRALLTMNGTVQTAMEKLRARIAVSEDARRTLVEHVGGDAVLIPNGVSCQAYEGGSALPGWPGEGGTLMFIGRLGEPRKGLSILIEAMPAIIEAFPNVRCLVAGPGDVEEIVEDLDPQVSSHMEFLGLVSEQTKIDAFHSVDVYVAPHTGGESFGIVLLEAMASGTPVLASDLPAFSAVLAGGAAGQLFATGDSAELAQGAIALLSDAPRRQQLSQAGLARAHDYDWSTVAREIVEVYESVTVGAGPVQCDLRGQLVGRLANFTRGDSEADG